MVLSCQVLRINEEQTRHPARTAVTEALGEALGV